MNFIFNGVLILTLIIYIIYPPLVYVGHLLFGHRMEHRVREYKLFAARLALVEYQMIQTINGLRKRQGLTPIPHEPVLGQFKGVGSWAGLKIKCEETVRYALNRLARVKS